MRGREFPPPLLPSQLLIEKNESGNQIQDGGGKVHQRVGLGLAAPLFPLAHGVSPPFDGLIIPYLYTDSILILPKYLHTDLCNLSVYRFQVLWYHDSQKGGTFFAT